MNMKFIIKCILPLCLLAYLTGCEDNNLLHQKYLDEGEKVYTGKIDSLAYFKGNQRVKFTWKINPDPRIDRTVFSWLQNDKDTAATVSINREELGWEALHLETILNVREGIYTFKVVTMDSEGNKSLSDERTVQIYGPEYISKIINRSVTSASVTAGEWAINWGLVGSSAIQYTTVYYTDYTNPSQPVAKSIRVANNQTSTQITGVLNDSISVSTAYLPDKQTLDTLFALPKKYAVKEMYRSMLKARKVINANTGGIFKAPVTLEWSAADESVLKTVLTYKSSTGIPVERIVTPTETNVTITDYEWGGTYSATTYFVPEPGALDTFVIAAPDGTFPVEYWFDKKGWIPYALATHISDGDGIACMLDGNYDSYWNSPYSESYNISTKPLYWGFDMLTEKYIKAIKLEKRYDTRIVEFRTSRDNENWETIGTVTIDDGNQRGTGTLTLNTPVNARYVRLYQIKSGNADGRGCVFQIDVLGSEITPANGIFQYDRSTWQVLSVSDETASDGGGKNSLIDNTLTNYWHSGSITVPHWAIIDMGESKDIAKIVTYRRRKNTDTKTVQYFVGNDPNPAAGSWVKIAEGSLPALIGSNSGGEILTIDIPASVNTLQGRYLKLVLPDTNNGNNSTSVAEIYVYGKIRT
jgi:hypothetical protein